MCLRLLLVAMHLGCPQQDSYASWGVDISTEVTGPPEHTLYTPHHGAVNRDPPSPIG